MAEKENRQKLLEYLKTLTAQDPQHPRIVDMTPLGLVEITVKSPIPPWQNNGKKYKNLLINQSTLVWLVFCYISQFQETLFSKNVS